MNKKILSLLLALTLIFGVLPVSAFAAESNPPVSGEITAFAALDESVANQSYDNIEQMTLGLIDPPDTLTATVELADDETASPATTGGTVTTEIPVQWDLASREETGNGGYINRFAPIIGDEFTLAQGVTLPTVTITVAQMDAPEIAPLVSGIASITQLNAAIAAFNSGADDATATITGDFDTAGTEITAIDNADGKILTIISDDTHRTITRGKTGDLFTVTKGTLVLEDITIDGGSTGTTYNANSGGTLVKVGSNGKLTMKDGATLQNNIRVSDNGGGVYNEGTFIMNGGTISGNTVTEDFMGGGGVYNDNKFTMTGGTISGNTVSGSGGMGGGVYNYDTFTMTEGTISGNTASGNSGNSGNSGIGGGVYVWGKFTMSGGTISGNKASQNGGGVHTQSGTFEMTGGTISGNEANQAGGGVFQGSATVKINGTAAITGNKATLFGGGVCVSANQTLKIKGSPQITGNIKGTGVADTGGVRLNGYSNESMPKIEIETGGLTATARIGIESMYVTDTGTVVAINAVADDVSKFYISNAEGTIGANNGLVLSGTDIVLGTATGGGGGTGGTGGGTGGGGTTTPTTPTTPTTSSSGGGSSKPVAPSEPIIAPMDNKSSGTLNNAINSAVKTTTSSNGKDLGVILKNVSNFTKDNAAAILKKAKALGKKATVSSDIMSESGSYVEVRVTVNPELIAKTVRLDGYTRQSQIFVTESRFKKYFDNKTAFVHLGQEGKFGQTAKIAAKLDLSGFESNNLYFYSYDRKTNTYTRIENPAYRIDKSGYLHFEVAHGGDIIISNGRLEKK